MHFDSLETRTFFAAVPAGFVETIIASGISDPTTMAFAPDGRLFVAEQSGALRVIKNDQLLPTPFVKLNVDSSGERGLLGIAFSPKFAANQLVYVYYTVPATDTAPAHNRVSTFRANGDVAVKGSEDFIIDLNNLTSRTNHNGGAIHFGPDKKLYIAVGENANRDNAQSFNNLLGKVLRLNPDGSIPTDNPFFNTASGDNRAIWAYGLRNPFNFAFQRRTGLMFVNDVGQSTWEEINEGRAGANYGWPDSEGPTDDPDFDAPVFFYGHGSSTSTGEAIVGSAFYSPVRFTFPRKYNNDYFYADLVSGWIRRYDPVSDSSALFATGVNVPVAITVNADGDLFYLSRGDGRVTRVRYSPTSTPQAPVAQPLIASSNISKGHTLSIVGTGGDDQIEVLSVDGVLRVVINGSVQTYNQRAVRRIFADGLAGDDKIDLTRSPVEATLAGFDGFDTLFGTRFDDQLLGEVGNDQLFGMRGNDSLFGGDFNDTLNGGKGRDSLSGGDGFDFFEQSAGKDRWLDIAEDF